MVMENISGRFFERQNSKELSQMMTPYEALVKDRVVFLYGTIASYAFRPDIYGTSFVMDLLLALDQESNDPIKLVIDSPGGSVTAGLVLYDTIKSVKSPIYTIGRSCQSMAVPILAVGTKGHRYIYKHSRTMLHLPWGQISGDTKEIEIQQEEINLMKDQMIELLIENGAKKNKKAILKDIDREYWMSAEETIEYGLVDKIIEPGVI